MVLTRLDYAPLFGFDVIAPAYQKEFLEKFPESAIEAETGYDIDMTDIKDPKLFLRDHKQVFSLSNSPLKKKLKFTANSLILEHHKYSDFDSFSQEFKDVVSFIFGREQAVYAPTRIGLRKINSLVLKEESNIENFSGYFRDELIAHLKLPFVNTTASLDKHAISFSLPEEKMNVNLQFSSEKGKKDGADSRRFILDIDVFSTQVPPGASDLFSYLEKMNDLIFDLFWCSIGPKTESYLKGGT